MKKTLFTLCLALAVTWVWGQKKSNPHLFTGNTVEQEKTLQTDEEILGPHVYLQVGSPIPYSYTEFSDGVSLSIRFPWDVPYIPLTFDEDGIDVSKGYFSNKIAVTWNIRSNVDKISQIKIHRRLFSEANTDDFMNYTVVATLSKDSYLYEDTNIQGGVLYEYKVEATGVSSIPKKYITYITGVGYRNPTGVISGNVSFEGGNPVKDVVVRAEPQGATLSFGSSVLFSDNSQLLIRLPNKELKNAITLQGWVKLEASISASLFVLQHTSDTLWIQYETTPNSLSVIVEPKTGPSKSFTISGFYPNGNVDGRGDDLLNAFSHPAQPETDFANNFAHLSVVLETGHEPLIYLNGRSITESYSTLLQDSTMVPTITVTGSYVFSGFEPASVIVGKGLRGNVDEVRLWSQALDEKRIRTDFKRYLGGSESNLISYIRCDEKTGEYAYDISRVGFEFNKNHASIVNGTWSTDKPTSSQLGILGVTDAQGNYIISAIPFTGTGESYTITPMFGTHQFEPSQQLVFIGNGAEVINKIDFKDVSSFDFMGRVYYTTTGVFDPIGPKSNVTSVLEDGYNQYRAIINGNEQLISKGNHTYNESTQTLLETPVVNVPGANVYIDGNIVLDKNKRPVVTGPDGSFKIRVPIGEHYIEVRKDKHTFTHGGRFPAPREDGNDLFDFFEHQQTAVTFLDTTRVTLVGRVVGGTREAEKPIGFGHNGSVKETYNPGTDQQKTVDISSINNIGTATIKLTYGAEELQLEFTTNEETGEYKVKLLPLSYTIKQGSGIQVDNNSGIQLLQADEIVNLTEARDTVVSTYQSAAGREVQSDPYHFVKSFTYRSVPVLDVVSQASDEEVLVKTTDNNGNVVETPIPTDGFEYPVYTQGILYSIMFETFEEYINYDGLDPISDEVPIADGDFNITNNLALAGSEKLSTDPDKPSITWYSFKAGLPSITPPFVRNIDIRYRVNGKDYDARNYNKEGIILGGQSDGSQTFVTEAPDVPDIILRDPPGSNSFASIEKGTSLSIVEEGSAAIGQSLDYQLELKLGVEFVAGGGLAGPQITTDAVNSLATGISMAIESTNGKSITKTYTFNQTISTSSDPLYVGSGGDLYIGNTKNYMYGTYDNVQVRLGELPDTVPSFLLTNVDGQQVSISKQKAVYFSQQPTETFFIFSQRYILETLIPELESLIDGIKRGNIPANTPGVLTIDQYQEQVRLWKKLIQDNERTKYLALNDRENYKANIRLNIEKEIDALNQYIRVIQGLGGSAAILPFFNQVGIQTLADAGKMLESKLANEEKKIALLESQFQQNISFDAGVGEFTKSTETTIAQEKSQVINLDLDPSFETAIGFTLNKGGLILHTSNVLHTSLNTSLAEENTERTLISYTLKDNDPGNFLSVDVVNAFDGNGPIFSTLGGRTSCPYEGVGNTLFYNHAAYQAASQAAKDTLIFSGGEQISYATQQLQRPSISVKVANITDVPEEKAAEFTLILENSTPVGPDDGPNAYFDLWVDNSTNPHSAVININPNGNSVYVPYGEQVEFKLTLRKSVSDIYEYKDINVYLLSQCEPFSVYDATTISATFRPSCTSVQIDKPLDKWVVNAGDVFNADNTTNPLPVSVFGYNRGYSGFEDFTLEYRKATSPSWTRLRTYYNTQALLDEAVLQGEDQGEVLSGNTTTFPFDIGRIGLSDGEYELRAISRCANGTSFVSDVVRGTVDLNIPVQFGTPSPADGILGAGEDLRLRFSENILYSSALSKIEISGETNQQEIRHNVSVHFEGPDNTVVIEQPNIATGDFAMEFWLQNLTTGSAVLFDQTNGLHVTINSGIMTWIFGEVTLSTPVANDQNFHHYTLTYHAEEKSMYIYQDDLQIGARGNVNGIGQYNGNPLVIGGNSFIGNMHDLRLWSKFLTLSEAYAAQLNELTGSERDLAGYWPMTEGEGQIAHDRARFKHAAMTAGWDIKPKGMAYDFRNGQYLKLDKAAFVQITDLMDVTLSFWMKTSDRSTATIFSNGRGTADDILQSNGKANKWAVSIENGILHLYSEGIRYKLSTSNLADDTWHHIALVLRRRGSLQTYVDAALETSVSARQIGGLSGNIFWVGARGYMNTSLTETVDQPFTGKIDELRLWNLARSAEQIKRDRFNEIKFNALGLMLYAPMNPPDPLTGQGPKYYHMDANETVLPDYAIVSAGAVSYTVDAPPIKQIRPYLNFQVSHVINGDEMIITPLISDWSVLEGKIIDITVDRMFDIHGNRQASPVTWTAFVRRNEVAWYVQGGTQQLEIEKQAGDSYGFDIVLLNKGGKEQAYSIENVPSWLMITESKGTLAPNSTRTVHAEIAPELTIGEYELDLYLNTDFDYDEKILVDLRVLGTQPEWHVDPSAFTYNMNIIGKVKIDGVFSQDPYTTVAAFVGDEVRGVASLKLDHGYDEYFLYLTIYSNSSSGEEVKFKIWDAFSGRTVQATIDGEVSISFLQNEVIGFKSTPAIIENTSYIEQTIDLHQGWTWVSLYVEDERMHDLNALTTQMALTDNDMIKNHVHFDVYNTATGWAGLLTRGGGLSTLTMHKVKLGTANRLALGGDEVDLTGWSLPVNPGWNWLNYPVSMNVSVNDALALFNAQDGDIIKSQRSFAVYDPANGWTGTLKYLIAGEGYMLKAGNAQTFRYPASFRNLHNGRTEQEHVTYIEGSSLYEHNMNVIATVRADMPYDSVFVSDEKGTLRGKSAIERARDGNIVFLTVFGNKSDEKLMVYLSKGGDRQLAAANVRFVPDMILGTLQQPVILEVEESSGLLAYPTQFTKSFTLQFIAGAPQRTEIEITDMRGQKVHKIQQDAVQGLNTVTLEPNVGEGMYIVSVEVDGQKEIAKVIRK